MATKAIPELLRGTIVRGPAPAAAREPVKRIHKPNPNRRKPPTNHNEPKNSHVGDRIFLFHHIATNRVVYSFTPVMNNNDALKQLTYVGKKSVPRALRKDMWRRFAQVDFWKKRDCFLVFHHLREYRKLHETQYDPEFLNVAKKERKRMLMDQKANSIADLAASLQRNAVPATIRWENLLDAEFAKEWPDSVRHNITSSGRMGTAKGETALKNVTFGVIEFVKGPDGKTIRTSEGEPVTLDLVVVAEDGKAMFDAYGDVYLLRETILDSDDKAILMDDGKPMRKDDVQKNDNGEPMFGVDGRPMRKLSLEEQDANIKAHGSPLPQGGALSAAQAEAARADRVARARAAAAKAAREDGSDAEVYTVEDESGKEHIIMDAKAKVTTESRQQSASAEKAGLKNAAEKPKSTFGSFMSRIFNTRPKL